VHIVTEELDAGPILAQAAVPVLDGDDHARLAKRIQEQEHLLLPRALAELKPTWRQG
jgi:phosphoribosylglycinamide formyltransferase-1